MKSRKRNRGRGGEEKRGEMRKRNRRTPVSTYIPKATTGAPSMVVRWG
jgi:hypothetical protein